jgi:hypothetical protein
MADYLEPIEPASPDPAAMQPVSIFSLGGTVALTVALVAAASGALAEQPQTRTFYNEKGQKVGRATTRDGTRTFYNDRGREVGRAERRGNRDKLLQREGPDDRIVEAEVALLHTNTRRR